MNQDERNRQRSYFIARGHNSETIGGSIADAAAKDTQSFQANGVLDALLVTVPALDGAAATLTIKIFPADPSDADIEAGNVDALIMLTITGLARNTDHYIRVAEHTTNNLPVKLFGAHKMYFESSANAAAGGGAGIVVIPILSKHS